MKIVYLPDINVWLALTVAGHIHQPAAVAWIDSIFSDRICFCKTTQQGYLRLLTNRTVMGSSVLTMSQAWQHYDILLTVSRIAFHSEPENLEPHWRSFTASSTFSPKVWSDAYIAAFGVSAGLRVVTFDTGFNQYSGLSVKVLSP
jgi:uncharacterized protein